MPNTRNVDERIVEMRLDNKGFEEGAHKTISTLEKLEKALHLKGETKAFDDMTESVSKFNANPMISGLEKIKEGFSALEIVGMRVISNLTDSVYNFATKTIKSFTIDPITQGFGKFGEKTTAVSTLTAQGYELEKVNKLMEDLNWFTDETSYNFTDMVGNIAKFTATGQDLDQSVTAMEGIALWAAVSGQNAQKASMAMYQLSQAMGKGALKYDDYKSIQNASMDTQEFRQQAAAAAVELGYLKKAADGVWETTEKTAKANQSFDLAGLFSSDALSRTSWLSSEVMMNVFNRYSRAVAAVKKYLEDHADTVELASEAMRLMGEEAEAYAKQHAVSLDEAFKRLGYDMDEFSLKALKAGQNARTWGDVVDSVKDAVSTGWMSTFEHLFGDAETATKFWTDIANRFYDIFAEGGNTRNSILELAFGKGSEKLDKTTSSVKNMTRGWERFEKRLSSSGKTMEDFEKALYSVADRASLDAIENFNSVDEALRKGGISAELFKKAMDALLGTSSDVLEETDANARHATHSLEEMRQVAIGVLRGDFGNGEERRKAIEEMGYDFELIQAMAGQLKWGGLGMSDEKLIQWMELYYQYNHLGQRLGANSFAEYLSETADAANEATESIENFNDLYNAVVHGIEEVDEATGKAMTGGEYFRGAILNIIDSFMAIQKAFREASKEILGTPEQLATGLYKLVRSFYYFTDAMKISEGTATGLTTIFRILFSVIKGFGVVLKFAGGIAGDVLRAIMAVANVFGEMLGKLSEYDILENFGKAFLTILQAFGPPLNQAAGHIMWIFDRFKEALPGAVEKLGVFLENISKNALGAAESFKEFMASTKVSEAVSTAFGYIYYYLRAIKNGFKDVDLLGNFEKLYNWVKGIFVDVNPESSGLLLALEDVSDAVEPITRGIMGEPEEAQNRIRTFFETIKNTIVEELGKFSFSGLLNAMKVTVMTIFLAKVAGFVEQATRLTKSITSIPDAIAGVIGKFKETIGQAGDILVAFRKKTTAEAYIKVAAAIAILAASLWALSTIPRDDLTHTATVLALLMILLALIVKRMSALGKIDMFNGGDKKNLSLNNNQINLKFFNGLAAQLIGLAAVLGTIVVALALVRKTNPMTIVTTILGIVVLMGGIALALRELSKLPDYNAKGISLTLIALAGTIHLLMLPMLEIALLSRKANTYWGSLFGVIALLAALTGVIAVLSKLDKGNNMGNITKMAGSMALIALSIGLLLIPLATLAALPGNTMGKAFAALLGLSLILGIMSAMAARVGENEGSNNIIKIAAGMALFAVAMNLMIPVLAAFGSAILILEKKFTWEKIKDNLLPLGELAIILTGFAFAALLMGGALSKLGSGMLKIAGSFALFAIALLGLSFALEHVGNAFPAFIEGLIEAGKKIRGNEANFIWGAVAFTTFALAIGLLVKNIGKLFSLGNVGAKLTGVTKGITGGIGSVFRSIGQKMLDNVPTMLQLISGIVVLIGLYLLDIIPQLTEIAVRAVTEFLSSLAKSMEANRAQFVESVTSIVRTIFSVVKEVVSNVWNEMDFFGQLFTGLGIFVIAGRYIATTLIGTNGAGGILGAFKALTAGAATGTEAMATTTVATLSTLTFWLVGIAALVGGVINSLHNQQEQFRNEMSTGLGNSPEDYLEKIRRGQEAVNKAREEYNNLALNGADLTMAQEELDARQIALNNMYKEFAKTLGVTTKELKAQIEAADGDINKIDAVQKKLAETAKAAEETEQAVTNITKESQWEKVRADAEAFYKQQMGDAAEQGGSDAASKFANEFLNTFTTDGSTYFTNGGTYAADTTMNGLGEEMRKYIPNLGDDTVNGFLSSIYARYQDLFDGGTFMYDMVDAGYRNESNTNSPSVEMQKLGGYAVDGLVLGILNQSSDLDEAGGILADNLISTVSDAMAQVALMADDEFKISPNITPVVDSASISMAASNAQAEYGYWNDIAKAQDKIYQAQEGQRQEAIRQAGEYISLWDEYAVRADEIGGTVEYSLENSKMSGLVSDISNKVDALGQQMANMRVVLDSGRLVGGISYSMDQSLGIMSSRRGRGN